MDFPEFKFGYIPLISALAHGTSWSVAGQACLGIALIVISWAVIIPFLKFLLSKRRKILYLHNFDFLPSWPTAMEKRENPPMFFKFISNRPYFIVNSLEIAEQIDQASKDHPLETSPDFATAFYPLCGNAYRDMGKNKEGAVDVSLLLEQLNEPTSLKLMASIAKKNIGLLDKAWDKNMKVMGGVNIVRWNFNAQSHMNDICRDVVFGTRALLVNDKNSGKGIFFHLDEYMKSAEEYLQKSRLGYWGNPILRATGLDPNYKKMKPHAEVVRRLTMDFVRFYWDPDLIGDTDCVAKTLMKVYPDARTSWSQLNKTIDALTLALLNVKLTLRSTFSSCMHQMASQGELRGLLEKEIREMKEEDRPKVEQKIEQTIKELLRLEPLAPCLPPLVLKKSVTVKGGIDLKSGSHVIFSPLFTANDSKQWKHPLSLAEREEKDLDKFIKFSSHGHFNTLPLAITATRVLFMELLKKYDFTLSTKQTIQKVYRYMDTSFKDDFSITIVYGDDRDTGTDPDSVRS